jgi:hypothetical protein
MIVPGESYSRHAVVRTQVDIYVFITRRVLSIFEPNTIYFAQPFYCNIQSCTNNSAFATHILCKMHIVTDVPMK